MKIRLLVSEEDYAAIKEALESRNIEIDDDAELVLTQRDKYASYLSARRPETGERLHIHVDEIVYIESFGHTVELHTDGGVFETADRLYQLVMMLDPEKFLRVSISVIIARRRVRRINASLSMYFSLILSVGSRVYVTRSFYNIFIDAYNI